MIALDTNILVYAHRQDSPAHEAAHRCLTELAEGVASFGVPWPCISEFLAVVTHPRIYRPPTDRAVALSAATALASLPHLRLLSETPNHLELLNELAGSSIRGPRFHDARIAAICIGHGITELWTADRDFSYFPRLKTRNPLV